jgi:hypothetical protein
MKDELIGADFMVRSGRYADTGHWCAARLRFVESHAQAATDGSQLPGISEVPPEAGKNRFPSRRCHTPRLLRVVRKS